MSGSQAGPYFAFVDGSLDYDCVACGAHCCHGFGYGGMASVEMTSLVARHPELLPWVRSREGGFLQVGDSGDGCMYLEATGVCGIEVAEGRECKPGVCRQFPFNRVAKIGEHVAVMPHFLCPLELVVPARGGEVEGSHERVGRELKSTGLLVQAVPPADLHEEADAASTVRHEIGFRDACAAALGVGRAADVYADFASGAVASPGFLGRALALLETPLIGHGRRRDRLDDLQLAVAPTLSLGLLPLSAAGRLRALLLGDSLLRANYALVPREPSVRSVAELLSFSGPLLTMLAHDDEPFSPLAEWRSGAELPHFDDRALTAAFGAMIVLSRQGRGTLAALEEALAPLRGSLERVLFLRIVHGTMGTAEGERGRVAASPRTAESGLRD